MRLKATAGKRAVELLAVALRAMTFVLLSLSIAGYAGRLHKLLELATHFKFQYLLGALLCTLALVALRSWRWSLIAVVCFALNAAEIAPWYLSSPARKATEATPKGARLKLLLANVNFGNTEHARLIELIEAEQPDVLVLQEVNANWIAGLRSVEPRYPHLLAAPIEDDGSGIALYSRLPLADARIIRLGDESAALRPSIAARVLIGNSSLALLTIHPRAPLRPNHFELRNRQLADAARLLGELSAPKVFIGDINTTVWSPYYADFLRDADLRDARRGNGLLPTFPAYSPLGKLLMLPIDHCFVSRDVIVREVRTGTAFGSDHLPLIVELAMQ